MVYYSNESNLLETMSSDEQSEKECPLCMEALEIDDINFYPCKCEYQICRFCWHRLRTDENGLCPACRQPYPEDPVNFQPLTSADVRKLKSEKKQKLQQQKNKASDTRKHLSAYRVLQKNLVYVVGLSQKMADSETLKKPEYFGRFGKIMKVAVGAPQHQTLACTAYVTYYRVEDALKAIQSVNNAVLDGRMIKASLGTTKYCSNFLKGQSCHKQECMYLHEEAPPEISFTKEDMQAGKHSEYEKKLLEQAFLPEPKKRLEKSSADKNLLKTEQSVVNGGLHSDDSVEKKENSEPPESGYSSCNNEKLVLVENQPSINYDKISDGIPSASSSPFDQLDQIDERSKSNKNSNFVKTNEAISNELLNGETSIHNSNHLLQEENMRRTPFEHDDDLGFDPFSESSKALADLLEEEKSSYSYSTNRNNFPRPNNSFYQIGQEVGKANQSMLPPPGFSSQNIGPSNFPLSSAETSFLQSLRNPDKMDHRMLSYEHPQQPNLFPSGISFLESLRTNGFATSDYQRSAPSFHPYSEPFEAPHSSALGPHLHGINDPFATGPSSGNFGQRYREPSFLDDITRSQHLTQQPPAQINDWREEFKALLGPNFGNVNVHFASDIDSVYHALSDGNNELNGKHEIFYDNMGKAKEPSLEQMFSNSATIASPFPPPPGFQNHM